LGETGNGTEQIRILLEADKQFSRYEFEFSPHDAPGAAAALGDRKAAAFIEEANVLLKTRLGTRGLAHSVRLGRRSGDRIVVVEFFIGAIKDAYLVADELESMAGSHGIHRCEKEDSGSGIEVTVWWFDGGVAE
jgi:hypothetical protein